MSDVLRAKLLAIRLAGMHPPKVSTDKDLIKPTETVDDKIDDKLKNKLAKLKEQRIAQEHNHHIIIKNNDRGIFRAASLESNQGRYAKYWLLNAKEENGNGWGISTKNAKQNMEGFVGMPFVITSSKWHGASIYGESYEHPYLPTNDMDQIIAHQEQFKVGNIIKVTQNSAGDFHAEIKMLPKFAHMSLPPFCSPAIYQLDASESDGNISKWKGLHLAGLTEEPAYGARIALLKGTCIGTAHSCSVQFKVAKLVCPTKLKNRLGKLID